MQPHKAPDVHLTLCLTHDCNLRCRYCYSGPKRDASMSESTARAAFELALDRVGKRLHLVFFGGEPLLRWDALTSFTALGRTLCAPHGVELSPTVTTNGTLLTQQRCEWLAEERFVVAVSYDGIAPAHDANRRDASGASSHARVVDGLRCALAAGLRVRAILVLDPSNLRWIGESIDEARDLGVRDFVVNPNWSADWSAPAVRESLTEAYAALAARHLASYRRGDPLWISALDAKISAHVKGGILASEHCDLGCRDLVVAPSGNLFPCDRMIGDDRSDRFVIGHVSLGVDADKLAEWLEPMRTLPAECLTCSIRSRCRNRCACANFAMTRTPSEPSSALCLHEQLAIRAADDVAEELFAESNEAFFRRHYPGAVG